MGKRKNDAPDEQPAKRAKIDEKVQAFLGSDSESDDDFGGFIDADQEEPLIDDDSEDEDLRKMEEASRALEEQQRKMEEEGMIELRETLEEKLQETAESLQNLDAPNIVLVKERMSNILDILRDFRNLRQEDRSRSDYIAQLVQDFCTFYGYNEELMILFADLFSPDELHAFLESNESERPVTIRTNTLKTKRKQLQSALQDRGVQLEPVGAWTPVGLKINSSRVPVGATPEYLAGHYIRQSPSSYLPVMALAPKSGEKVLDMAAAPGGKTSHIAQRMKNSGLLVANDVSKPRLASLTSNLHRLGVANAMVVNVDGKELPKYMKSFDKILLDAPCTGLGVISRDASIKQNRHLKDVWKLSKLQKELILAAIDMLEEKSQKSTLVYSTCSVSVEENEDVVAYALQKRHVKLVHTGLSFGRDGFTRYKEKRFPPNMKLTKRYYPHVHNMDGFFVAKLVKMKHGPREAEEDEEEIKAKAAESDSETAEKPKKKKLSKKEKKKLKKKKIGKAKKNRKNAKKGSVKRLN